MEQIEREYRDALDGLRFSGDAKERMVDNLLEQRGQAPVKRRGARPLRAGLIAAAVCVLLVGTAFAATTAYNLMVHTYDSRDFNGEELKGFELFGEVERYALEDFSQQLQDDYNTWVSRRSGSSPSKEFDSWEEAKAYVGEGIPCTWWDTGDAIWESIYRVNVIPDLSAQTDDLHVVQIYSRCRLKSWMTCETVVMLYGEETPHDWIYNMAGPLDSDIQVLEDYRMANGCTARIVAQVTPWDEDWIATYCMGFFVKSGMLYDVTIFGGDPAETDMAEMKAQLYRVLDSFE